MPENTVIIFGAGATKACGGPQQNEILRDAYAPELRAKQNSVALRYRTLFGDFDDKIVWHDDGFGAYVDALP